MGKHPRSESTLSTLQRRFRQPGFWLATLGLTVMVLGVSAWRPYPTTWPVGLWLHHLTLFCALYLTFRYRLEAHLAFSAALGLSVLPLLFTGGPLGQLTWPLIGEFGLLTSGGMIVIALMDYRWRHQVTPLFPVWLWLALLPVAVIVTLGQWVHRDIFPYFLGDNAGWLTTAMMIALVMLCLTGRYWAALLVALVPLGYEWRVLDSHNAWDYLVDPIWLLATFPILWRRLATQKNT